ncbi:MAG TPA: GAF domain-containing sensor histidine kinase [Thermoanaerobaculia bacterium]|nr:GAF domain-containing sensor histidine kinase [Thermoanaerobaculia bacterium]
MTTVSPQRFQAQYALPFNGTHLLMTLKRLRALAALMPILAVTIIEVARYFIVGLISWEKRLALDLVMVVAILIFTTVIFRFIDQMHGRLERNNEELLALHSAGLDVTADLQLDVVLKKVVEQAKKLVGAKYGALSVVDKEGHIQSFITSGITPEQRAAIGPPPVGHGLLGVVLREGQRLRLPDISSHPLSYGFPPNHPPMRSLLAVPIPCKSPFLGNLYLTEKVAAAHFSGDDEETLERFALQAALAIDNAHLHEQVADLAVAQERIRIAHEMHDGLAQILGYVNTKVQAAEAYLKREKTEEAETQLRELAAAAREAYIDVRESIVGLRTLPGSRQSLAEVLQEYLEKWQEMSGVSTTLTIENDVPLRASVELQLVRIVQEALTNVRKHARASNARVEIRRRNGRLVATVADNGVGFNLAARTRGDFPKFGLTTMRERAESIGGTLDVESTAGGGTTVRFDVPLAEASSGWRVSS